MKTKLLIAFIVFGLLHQVANAQVFSTLDQYKSYFVANSSKTDNIEGIWYVYETIVNDYGPAINNTFTVSIIKENNSYYQYKIVDGKYHPTPSSIEFIKGSGGYFCKENDSQCNIVMTSLTFSINNNKFGYSLDATRIFNCLAGKSIFKKILMKYSYSKTFPLSSDLNAK